MCLASHIYFNHADLVFMVFGGLVQKPVEFWPFAGSQVKKSFCLNLLIFSVHR